MTIKERAWKNWLKNTHNTTESLMDFTLEEVQKLIEEFKDDFIEDLKELRVADCYDVIRVFEDKFEKLKEGLR